MGELRDAIKIVYLENYDMTIAQMLLPGVDVWLNTPARPHEASGTSGMKAAHNGVPQFSILDGWWIEGHLEGVTGWRLGPIPTEENEYSNNDDSDAKELYDKLETTILPTYYDDTCQWRRIMRNTIAFNASYFNTHRMVQQYVLNAYLL
jgi:starch phosphorylase